MYRIIREPGPDWSMGLVEADDGALLYVESQGRGRPLILVHGWSMSGRFWKRQLQGLSGLFRVVAPDLRAHGRSGKALHGHSVPQYALDLRAVVESLALEEAILVGWSMGGPVVLDYLERYEGQGVAGVVLVEATPYPFGPPEWNSHALAGGNFDGMLRTLRTMTEDRAGFMRGFIASMFLSGETPDADRGWMLAESLALPGPAAGAIYSDYLMRDYTPVLGRIAQPALVINGRSDHLCFGPTTGRFVADRLRRGDLRIFPGSGHMPFYEEADLFNESLIAFQRML